MSLQWTMALPREKGCGQVDLTAVVQRVLKSTLLSPKLLSLHIFSMCNVFKMAIIVENNTNSQLSYF